MTREAADIILTDDNFASIVAAVREGRGIFDNLRKTLTYLLAATRGELAVMLGAAVIGCRCRCCRCISCGSIWSLTACPRSPS